MEKEVEEKVYTEKELVSFGLYLLSEVREELFRSHPDFTSDTVERRLKRVHDADIANWKDSDASLI